MTYATDIKAVQKIIDEIGSVSNLSLSRIGSAKKCIFVEGEDLKILAKFADILYPKMTDSVNELPHASLGGFQNLNEAFGASKLFFDETNGTVRCMCILDSDYFPLDLLEEKKTLAQENNLILHIWNRKELENYVIEPRVLFRLTALPKEEYESFLQKFEALLDTYQDDVFDQYAEHIVSYRKCGHSTANKEARKYMNEHWKGVDGKLALVSGKKVLRDINRWMRSAYGVSCSLSKIIASFTENDVCDEMKSVIADLVEGLETLE